MAIGWITEIRRASRMKACFRLRQLKMPNLSCWTCREESPNFWRSTGLLRREKENRYEATLCFDNRGRPSAGSFTERTGRCIQSRSGSLHGDVSDQAFRRELFLRANQRPTGDD